MSRTDLFTLLCEQFHRVAGAFAKQHRKSEDASGACPHRLRAERVRAAFDQQRAGKTGRFARAQQRAQVARVLDAVQHQDVRPVVKQIFRLPAGFFRHGRDALGIAGGRDLLKTIFR